MIKCPSCGDDNRDTARFCSNCGGKLTLAAPLAAGDVLVNRYRVMKLLGQGGMGSVYLVEDVRLLGKKWALKELVDLSQNQQGAALFQQEVGLLSTFSHPNLPHVTDYFLERGRYYFVMEFVDGETLVDRLAKAKAALPEKDVTGWALQVCDVLEYLHSQTPPVIFRDLKPANIMMDGRGTVKLIDFGIARHFAAGKTKDTIAMGTPGYCAPEQYGTQQTDARSDIYSLGATIHQLVTGRDPCSQPFVFPPCNAVQPAVSAQLTAIVARMVEQDASRRFRKVADVSTALRALNAPGSVVAPTILSAPTSPARPYVSPVGGPPVPNTKIALRDLPWITVGGYSALQAYCNTDKRVTNWLQEGSGELVCADCDTELDIGTPKMSMTAFCPNCGIDTQWIINEDGEFYCVGCGNGQSSSTAGWVKVVPGPDAFCSGCGKKAPWLTFTDYDGSRSRICIWCGNERS